MATVSEARDALDAGAQERVAAAERQVAALPDQLDAFVTSRP
ncbi:hypothetical protein [Amycolatopsis pithecellobii]|nr:hypothetical protein [Amycolatopsis pithecellobii]